MAPARAPPRPPARRGAGRGAPPVGRRDRRRPRGGRQGLPALGRLDRRALGRPGPDGHRLAREGAPPPAGPHPVRAARADPGVAGRPDAGSRPTRPRPCSPGARRTPSSRSTTCSPPRSRWSSSPPGTPWAGRWRRAAPRPSPMRWPPTSPSWGARSAPGSRSPRWRSCRRHGPSCSTSRRARSPTSPGIGCPSATAPASVSSAPVPPPSRSTTPCPARCRGRTRPVAEPGPCTSGGTADEVAASEATVGAGQPPERPYVLVAQQSLVDPSRAPAGRHTLWAYCHVPNGSTFDMTERVEAQIERFAPGFRDLVLARHVARAGVVRVVQPVLPRRRHRGRRAPRAAARLPADDQRPAVPHARPHAVPVLGVHPSGRRRPRDVRPPCRQRRAGQRAGLTDSARSQPARRRWPDSCWMAAMTSSVMSRRRVRRPPR